ncbi:DUF2306 domain-containing protein [Nonomuraea sp. NPDC049480]|uniref:DUF2306 domain-containing protein n=1 Tax=Nonomuraea sp. NPDC049480 TaxID=3364353 RepID=UPI0037B7C14C
MTHHVSGAPARARRIWLMAAVAAVFGAVLVTPCLGLDAAGSRLDVGGGARYYLLVAHIFTALVALVLGPLQYVPAIRARRRARRRAHRTIGRCYLLAGVLPSALTAIPVALLSGRLITQIGLTIPAVLWLATGWLATGWLAFRAARRRDFVRHRQWMMRNYALTFLAVTSRVLVPLILLAQVPFSDTVNAGSIGASAQSVIPIGQVLGWIVNLAVVEIMIRRP